MLAIRPEEELNHSICLLNRMRVGYVEQTTPRQQLVG